MTTFLHTIATRTPEHAFSQTAIRDRMLAWTGDAALRRKIQTVYNRSGIETRHSVLRDFLPGAEPELFRTGPDGTLSEPTTQQRNRAFIPAARELAVGVAGDALAHAPAEVTHLITVSCTGFSNPGPDFDIVTRLGLSPGTERYHLGFMGCYAAFPALRMARQFCEANPEAVVLVTCVELCSLHLQCREDEDSLLGNALFADGAAAAIVSARPPAPDRPCFVLDHFAATIAPNSADQMAWEIGDRGFNLILSSYVPRVIAANLGDIVDHALSRAGRNRDDMGLWAVHPGGRAILDRVASALGLAPEQLAASREVLRHNGNMSSPTILFVLKRILESHRPAHRPAIFAAAFGPGLTIETAILEYRPVTVSSVAAGHVSERA